jgi:hypothetical protein
MKLAERIARQEKIKKHKEELISSIVDVMQNNEENYQDTIWSLVHEALKTRTIKELKEIMYKLL